MTAAKAHNLLISTRNPDKVREIHAIMTELPLNLVTLDRFPDSPDVIEDCDTLDGNATKKAEELFAHTGTPTMADDTGLEVLALSGAPGVHSARFAGPNADSRANRMRLLDELSGMDERRAQFRTVIAFAISSGTYLFEGICRGHIIEEERGEGGFGYDSLFVPDGYEQTFAEMSPEEKNKISHRARALNIFASYLAGLIQESE